MANSPATQEAPRLTTGPLIAEALRREGVAFEMRSPYLRIPTANGEILIEARNCNRPCGDDTDTRSGWDIGRHLFAGWVATWWDTTDPDGGAAEVYDGNTSGLGPVPDAEECAFAVRAFLAPDGGHRLRLLKASLDTSRPQAAARARAELRQLVADGVAAARERRARDAFPF
ncbi:hypothetical protein [Streptomyces sp. NPDC001450]